MPVNRDAKLMTMMTVRATNDDDDARLGEIAAEGGSADADGAYFAFVRRAGRLLAAVDAAGVVQAYGGTVPVGHQAGGTVTMVTDLFVAAAARGAGTGRLLLDQLLPDRHRVMTSSSAPMRSASSRSALARAGCSSTHVIRASPPASAARCVALAPGAAHMSSTCSPGFAFTA